MRFRRHVLTAYQLRDPATLAEPIDPVWRVVTTKTLRVVVVGSASRRERCKTDPRWAALQGDAFTREEGAPAERGERARGGAALGQAVGTMISALAGVPP